MKITITVEIDKKQSSNEMFDREVRGRFKVESTFDGDFSYDNMSCALAAIYHGLAKDAVNKDIFTAIWEQAPYTDKLAKKLPTEE